MIPFFLKQSLTLMMSRFKKSEAQGWSFSMLWETSMKQSFCLQQSRLYSLRSPWMSLHSWQSMRMLKMSWRQASSQRTSCASLSLGAATMSSPMNSMRMRLDLTRMGSGQGILDCWILLRFRNSFSAQRRTILRGFDLQWPLRKRNSPLMYLSLSLKTKMEVLQILIAYSLFSKSQPWYTLASLPVEMQPLISLRKRLLSIFIKMTLVLGSRHCSTVALSSLSLILVCRNSFFLVKSAY